MLMSKEREAAGETPRDELQPADIILVHTRRSLWGWLIRTGTRCYWNHAMMIYSTGENGHNTDRAIVIDPRTDGSILFRNLSEYLERTGKYDIAVKRFKSDEFSAGRPGDLLENICLTAAGEVQHEPVGNPKRTVNRILRQFTVIWRFIRRKLHRANRHPALPWNIRPYQVKAFTCSGFVQWCYYMGAVMAAGRNPAIIESPGTCIFNPHLGENPTPYGLLTTTPADLANSEKLSWVCVIRHGKKSLYPNGTA